MAHRPSAVRTLRMAFAALLALALGLVPILPAQAVPGLPPVPEVGWSTNIQPAKAATATMTFTYQGTVLSGPSYDDFVANLTLPGNVQAASCGGLVSPTLLMYCVVLTLPAVAVPDGASLVAPMAFEVAEGVVRDTGVRSPAHAGSVPFVRVGAPGSLAEAVVGTVEGVPTALALAASPEVSGGLVYDLAQPFTGVRVQGSTLWWDGVTGGTAQVRATDTFGQSSVFFVELERLARVQLSGRTATLSVSSSPQTVGMTASGATLRTSYRVVGGGNLDVTSISPTLGGPNVTVGAGTAGTFSALIEAYEIVGGRDIVLGSATMTVTFAAPPSHESGPFLVSGLTSRSMNESVVLSTDRSVTSVTLVENHVGWASVAVAGPSVPDGTTRSTLQIMGTPLLPGNWPLTVRLSNAHGYTDVDVDVRVDRSPAPRATITQSSGSGDVTLTGGSVRFNIDWTDPATDAPASIVDVAVPADFVVTGVADPDLLVTRVSADRWTLDVRGSGWAGNDVIVQLRAGAVHDAWGVTNSAAAGSAHVRVVGPPVVTTPAQATGVVGSALSIPLTASSAAPGATFTWRLVDAPAWLTLGGSVLSGTPTAAGTFPVLVEVQDSLGQTVQAPLPIEVAPAPAPPTFQGTPSASLAVKVGERFSVRFEADGHPTPTLAAGTPLPAGVTLTDDGDGTATFAGTPTVAGTWSIDVVASNASGSATHTVVLSVAAVPAPVVTLPATVAGVAGAPVPVPLDASTTAADPALTWSLVEGPSWLSLSGTTLEGTPPAAGSFPVVVSVTDSLGQVTRAATTLEIAPAPVAPTFVGAPPTSVSVTAGQPVSVTFTASGNPVPVFSVVGAVPLASSAAGAFGGVAASRGPVVHTAGLPAGVTLTDHGDGTATLAGTPTVEGSWSFDVVASNGSGRVAHAVRLDVAAVTPPPTTPPAIPPTVPPTVPPTETPSEEPTQTPTETPTDGPTDDESDEPSTTEPSTTEPSTTEPSDDDVLPVTGARPLAGLGLAVLLAAAGVVALAVRRRTA